MNELTCGDSEGASPTENRNFDHPACEESAWDTNDTQDDLLQSGAVSLKGMANKMRTHIAISDVRRTIAKYLILYIND